MSTRRIFVTFKPSYGKHMGHVSRKLMEIEDIIFRARGADFAVDPHNTEAFMFHLPDGVGEREADDIVQCLATLADDDGQFLLEVEQGWKGISPQIQALG
jgi:hypothetical protein